MPRARNTVNKRRKHKKVLELTKGYRGAKSKTFKSANEQVMRSLAYAYRDRRTKKRDFRKLWITRINAAARENGISYNRLIDGLRRADIKVDRKILAEMAVNDPEGFGQLVKKAKEKLSVS